MSELAVKICKVSEVIKHPNADKLQLFKLEGYDYQFGSRKDEIALGESVIYFPIDSVLPTELADKLSIRKFLGGTSHNRVRCAIFRGEASQGFICKMNKFDNLPSSELGTDLTEFFGVTKFEGEINDLPKDGNLVQLPVHVYKYDIDNAENRKDVIEYLSNENIWLSVTEKIEGSHFAATYDVVEDKFTVCQRNFAIVEKEQGHTWCILAKKYNLENVLKNIVKHYIGFVHNITIRGEVIGPKIQGNYYELKEHKILFFEIEIDGKPIDFTSFKNYCTSFGGSDNTIEIVPVLKDINSQELKDLNLKTYCTAKSVLIDKLREGIVIKPRDAEITIMGRHGPERLIIKQRSPEYLAKGE